MGKAKPENCTHPVKQREKTAYARYKCGRCDLDLTDPRLRFSVRHSERVTLNHGDRVAVSREHCAGAFKGIFLYATDEPKSGTVYLVAETQTYTLDKKTYEGWAALRTVFPAHVRQAPGVRDRKQRAEEKS